MPTIIDELVLRFSLDPKGFDEGQRTVVDKIDRLQDHAKKAGGQVEKTGTNIVSFFRGIEQPVAALRGHFEKLATSAAKPQRQLVDLASQARRTGTSVEAGALSGAAGLRVLGAAGLGAFAALKGINTLMRDAGQNARAVFGTSLGAAGAGTSIERYTAISQALKVGGNVPEADTQSWLTAFTQAKERAAQGDYGAAIALNRQMAIAGINADVFTSTPEQALVAAARRFSQVSPATARASGDLIGMSPELTAGLRQSGDNLPKQIADERRAVTQRDTQAARDLLKAQNDLSVSWNKLARTLYDDLTPALASWEGWLAKIVDSITTISSPDTSHQQKMDAYGGIPGSMEWFKRKWQSNMPTWLGGNKAGSGDARSGTPVGGVSAGGPVPPGLNNLTTDDVAIMKRESQGRPNVGWAGLQGSPEFSPGGTDLSGATLDANGFPMWPGKMGPAGNSTAAGLFMITRTNWSRIAPKLGIHDFSPESQLRVRRELQREAVASGQPANSAWVASGAVLPVGPPVDAYAAAPAAAPSAAPPFRASAPTGGFDDAAYRAAHGHLPDVLSLNGRATQPLDVIRRAQAAAASKGGDTNHNVEVSGGIHVHTAATTATGIAAAALMAGKNAGSLVTQANTGLE